MGWGQIKLYYIHSFIHSPGISYFQQTSRVNGQFSRETTSNSKEEPLKIVTHQPILVPLPGRQRQELA
jgi:hypothetical protein